MTIKLPRGFFAFKKRLKPLGKGVFLMNYIKEAREAVTTYEATGGIPSVELQNILAVLIGPKSTPELTGKLAAYGIKTLVDMTISELQKLGLTKGQSQTVHAGCLMACTLKNTSRTADLYSIRTPKDAAMYMMDELSGINQEHFVALYLNTKNQVIHKETVFVGGLSSAVCEPRDIFRAGLKHSAANIVLLHSHPSGDPMPSPEDVAVTKRLVEIGELMGLPVLDHCIIGNGNYTSLKEKGFM